MSHACLFELQGDHFPSMVLLFFLRKLQHVHQSINHHNERYNDSCNFFDWIFSFFVVVRWIKSISFIFNRNMFCIYVRARVPTTYSVECFSIGLYVCIFYVANDWLNKCEKSKNCLGRCSMFDEHCSYWIRITKTKPRIDQIKSVHILFSFPFAYVPYIQ